MTGVYNDISQERGSKFGPTFRFLLRLSGGYVLDPSVPEDLATPEIPPIIQFHVYPIDLIYRNWKLEHDNIS